MALSKIGTDGISADTAINGFTPTVSNMAGRNRLINSDMRIDQRNAGASVTISHNLVTYCTDRWNVYESSPATNSSAQQVSDAPSGFKYSLRYTNGTAGGAVSGTENARFQQRIEGYNVADLMYGSADAKNITISFWVKSSITGTYCVSLLNSDATRSYVAEYTINSTNTWEYKTVTIAGDTTGTWLTTNGNGLGVSFMFSCGASRQTTANTWTSGVYQASPNQVDLTATTGATFYITGVQLEEGSVATPFEHVDYGEMLRRCQRYYQKTYDINETPGTNTSASYWVAGTYAQTTNQTWGASWTYPVEMRATPTITFYTSAGDAGSLGYSYGAGGGTGAVSAFGKGSKAVSAYHPSTAPGMTTGNGVVIYGHIVASAEL